MSKNLYVLVTAHPDDESMFFVPTLYGLWQRNKQSDTNSQIWLLCMTTGNYDGLGTLRTQELKSVCNNVLTMVDKLILLRQGESDKIGGVPGASDSPSMPQDHPTQAWDLNISAQCVHQALHTALTEEKEAQKVDSSFDQIHLITFDEHGVSGHVNHRDTFYAVQRMALEKSKELPVQVWILITEHNLLVKYIPAYGWYLLFLTWLGLVADYSTYCTTRCAGMEQQQCLVFRLQRPLLNWQAMATHKSQFVWYRRLFVIFSTYTYANVLFNCVPPHKKMTTGNVDKKKQ